MITTNTFSSTVVAQRDDGLDDPELIHEINVAAAPGSPVVPPTSAGATAAARWVAGAIGPTNVTLSLSPKVEDPGFR